MVIAPLRALAVVIPTIIGRSLTPLNSSKAIQASASATTTRAGKCRMSEWTVALTAGGMLDWFSFDAAKGAAATGPAPVRSTLSFLLWRELETGLR
jgi:hypothetical protein